MGGEKERISIRRLHSFSWGVTKCGMLMER